MRAETTLGLGQTMVVNGPGKPMSRQGAVDRKSIVIGRALPFSVFGADRKLLLAKGQIVTDRIREALLRDGVIAVFDDASTSSLAAAEPETAPTDPLDLLRQHYSGNPSLIRCGFRISREERADGHMCWVVGMYEPRGLILTAPVNGDGTFLSITPGQSWLFRTFYATGAFRFVTSVRKVVFEPFPHFHVDLPALIEARAVRQHPRVQVCIPAKLPECSGVIVDLSSSGARLALDEKHALSIGQRVQLEFKLTILDQSCALRVQGDVVTSLGAVDDRHPKVRFYGMRLETDAAQDRITLHAFVHERLANDLDGLSRLLGSSPPR